MPIVSWQIKTKIHGVANLAIIFGIIVLVGAYLWLIIPYWWLWLVSIPIWSFGVMFVGHRIVPLLTNCLIEAIFKTKWDSKETVPFQLKDPWKTIDINDAGKIEKKLLDRLAKGHPLKGLQVKAMAERIDGKSVLFYTSNSSQPIAVVGLESSGENKPGFLSPSTKQFTTWNEWRKSEYQKDAAEYAASLSAKTEP